MRQIAFLQREDHARRFAAYLVTEGISAHTDADSDGWAIWVREEDEVVRAKDALRVFQFDPDNPRYRGLERAVATLSRDRSQASQAPVQPAGNTVAVPRISWRQPLARRAPLVLVMILLSGTVFFYSELGEATEFGLWIKSQLLFPSWQPVVRGELWRTITPIFYHFSAVHIAFCMYMFYQFGADIEQRKGTAALGLIILLIAIVSNLAQAQAPKTLGGGGSFGGMSGVVFGLFGYVWLRSRLDPQSGFSMSNATVILLMVWFFLCMTPVINDIANVSQVVGLAAGAAIGYATRQRGNHAP